MNELKFSVNRNKMEILSSDTKRLEKEKKCYFCGVNIEKHSHIHQQENNIVKSCSLCFYTEHLDSFNALDKGTIILMPELSQVELFSLVRMIWFLNKLEEDPDNEKYEEIFDSANNMYNFIKNRSEFATTYYANNIDNLDMLTNFLYSIDDEKYNKRELGLKHLRWLPSKQSFDIEIDYWIEEEYKRYNPKNFKELIKKVVSIKKGRN